ncbi:MAG: hypothetical protein WAV56_03520 [Microgenomates group bacterium]
MAKLTDFMVSRVRAKLIKIFLARPTEMYYVRELTRAAKEEINAVRRELARMEEKGMVKNEKRGNRLYYQFRDTYPFYGPLLEIVAKTTALGKTMIANRNKLGFIKFAFFSGRFVRGLKRQPTDVDLVVIGKVIAPQLALIIKDHEETTGAEVNYSTMTEEEFGYRLSRKDPFITGILTEPRVMIIGDDVDMVV